MSSDSYLKSLKDRLKSLDNKKAEKQLNQWSYNVNLMLELPLF